MKHDDLMQKIDTDVNTRIVNNKETLEEATKQVFDQYREQILETVELMYETIDEDEWMRHNSNVQNAASYIKHKCT